MGVKWILFRFTFFVIKILEGKISGKTVVLDDDSAPFFSIKEYGPLSTEDLGGEDIFEDIKTFVKKLIMIDPWELVKMTHNHESWEQYKANIIQHDNLQYTDKEIKDCFARNEGNIVL